MRKDGREERVRVSRRKDGNLIKKNKRLIFTHCIKRAVYSLLKKKKRQKKWRKQRENNKKKKNKKKKKKNARMK